MQSLSGRGECWLCIWLTPCRCVSGKPLGSDGRACRAGGVPRAPVGRFVHRQRRRSGERAAGGSGRRGKCEPRDGLPARAAAGAGCQQRRAERAHWRPGTALRRVCQARQRRRGRAAGRHAVLPRHRQQPGASHLPAAQSAPPALPCCCSVIQATQSRHSHCACQEKAFCYKSIQAIRSRPLLSPAASPFPQKMDCAARDQLRGARRTWRARVSATWRASRAAGRCWACCCTGWRPRPGAARRRTCGSHTRWAAPCSRRQVAWQAAEAGQGAYEGLLREEQLSC